MIVAEDIRNAILRLARQRRGKTFQVDDVARQINPNNWQELLEQVKLVVDALVKEGKIATSKKGTGIQIVDGVE